MKEVQALGNIRFGTLARAAEGLTQWRPLLLAFLTLLLTGALVWLSQWMAIHLASIMALLMMLLAFVVMMAGFSGVGIMLMDKARQQPVRSFAAAASAGLLCLPKFLLIAVVMTLAFIAYMIVAAIIYFVCKIPFVGGLLAFVVHPVLVLSFAAVLIALLWVVGPLMAPALWSGLPVKAAIANVLAIARKRLIEVVLLEALLYIILSLIGVLLFAGLLPASLSLTALGASILGDAGSMMAMSSMGGYGAGYGSPMNMLGAGGNTWGLVAGLGVLYCVIGALITQVAIMGMNLIYLQVRGKLDPEEAEDALNDLMGDMRKKAGEAKERARQAAQELAARKNTGDTAAAAAATAATTTMADAPTANSRTSQEQSPPSQDEATGAAVAAAGLSTGHIHTDVPPSEDATRHEAMSREQAARERAAVEAEAEAAAQAAAAQLAEQARLKEQAQAQARAEEQAREQARIQALAAAEEKARLAAIKPSCPNCHAPVAAHDLFCGECGNKLQ